MKKILVFLILSVLVIPVAASAMVLEGGQAYTLAKDKAFDENLYAAGSTVNLLGSDKKDVWLAGGTILVAGNVGQDLNLAGGNISIDNEVGDDLRVAGGNITINSVINGELVALGGQITIGESAKTAGDALIAGGNILADGNFGHNLSANGGTIEIDGNVAGDVSARASQKLVIGSSAVISGSLDYYAPAPAEIQTGAKINGQTTFHEFKTLQRQPKQAAAKFFGISWLISFLMTLTAALVAYALLRRQIEATAKYVMVNFWKETLRGLIIAIVLPIVSIICLVTIIGVMLGGMAILLYILFALFAAIFAPILLGTLIWRLALKKPDFGASFWSVVVGVLVMRIIRFIPIAGWIFYLIFFLAAFGSLFFFLWRNFKTGQAA